MSILLTWIGLYLVFFAVSLGCLVAMLRLLVRHMQRMRDLFSNIEDKSLSWLRWVLVILAAAWGVAGLQFWLGEQGDAVAQNLDVLIAVFQLGWVAAFGYFGERQQPIYKAAPQQSENSTEPAPRKYARSALDDDRMSRIATRLQDAMSREHLYRDPTLSLRMLSDRLGVSGNYLSQTLNEQIGKNFFDYINEHRIDAAKRIFETGDSTVLEVALQVGFNSRSTFNAAFKKHAGVTPSAFRAANQKETAGGSRKTDAS